MSKAKKFVIPLLIVALMCSIMFALSGCYGDDLQSALTVSEGTVTFAYNTSELGTTPSINDYLTNVGNITLTIKYNEGKDDAKTFTSLKEFVEAGGLVNVNLWSNTGSEASTGTLTYNNASTTFQYTVSIT